MSVKGVEELSPVGKPSGGGMQQRCGPWSDAEVAFATRLSDDFKAGLLPDVPNGIPLRKWLSEKLNCTPMRLSKKFDKTSGVLGMCRYTCNVMSIASMSAEKSKRRQEQLDQLEAAFRQAVHDEQTKLSEFHIQQTHKHQYISAATSTKKRKKSGSTTATPTLLKRAKASGSAVVGGHLLGTTMHHDYSNTSLAPNQADLSLGFLLLELQKGMPPARVD
ncbi:hypothetical protein DYB32_004185 [Aphanomyces invadans]|uniref:Uncharacterized protein n=1 Tax=Aphanomyces invadans TaxID=157072 RepID=A0A418AYG4_9STRA|nr:hypothetical protein DYB32_004185 [Aphanomyces invadans]